MRLKYYMVSLRQMKMKKSFVFLFILFVMIILFSLYYKTIEASFIRICTSNAHSIALNCTEKAIQEKLSQVTYQSIINVEKTEEGKIVALTSNVNELNRLSNELVIAIEENLQKNEKNEINVPLGLLLGSTKLGGYGFKVGVKTIPIGDVDIEYISYFDSVGINQTRHRIIARITVKAEIVAPFVTSTTEYHRDIVLAETILVGDIPESYYYIDGIKDLQTKDILNMD